MEASRGDFCRARNNPQAHLGAFTQCRLFTFT